MNLAHDPIHTYIFDDHNKTLLEENLDNIRFFTDIELGLTMDRFILTER